MAAEQDSIMVNLEVLDSKVTMLAGLETSLNTVKQTISSLVDNTYTYWEGSAEKIFESNQKELLKSIATLSARVNQCKTNLYDAIAVYRRIEGINKANIDNLSTDNIF